MSPYLKVPGLGDALCALSFFRQRHVRQVSRSRRGRLARRSGGQDLNRANDYRRMARRYIKQAREAGWRGSIRAAVAQIHGGAS